MAKFLLVLQPMKELMVWEEEISGSMTCLYDNNYHCRKQFVSRYHRLWHQRQTVALLCAALVQHLLPELQREVLQEPLQTKCLHGMLVCVVQPVWQQTGAMVGSPSGGACLQAACCLPERQKNHKVVLNFDDLLKFSEEVRQCEEDQLQGMYRGAMF